MIHLLHNPMSRLKAARTIANYPLERKRAAITVPVEPVLKGSVPSHCSSAGGERLVGARERVFRVTGASDVGGA